MDIQQPVLYLARSEEARRFMAAQWPRSDGPPLHYTPEELARLLADADLEEATAPPNGHERLAAALRESRASYRLMPRWLERAQWPGGRGG